MIPVDAGSFFGLSIDNIVAFVKGRGSFSMVEYAKLDAESAASLVDSFGALFVELASGVTKIRPQKDDSNVHMPLHEIGRASCMSRSVIRPLSELEYSIYATLTMPSSNRLTTPATP